MNRVWNAVDEDSHLVAAALLFLGGALITSIFSGSLARLTTHAGFGEEIDALQSDLVSRVLPEIRERAEEVAVGVGRFEDFPVSPFGSESDRPFTLLSGITTSEARASSALAALDDPLGQGGDTPESSAEALYQIATGDGFRLLGVPVVAAYDRHAAPGGQRDANPFRFFALRRSRARSAHRGG